MLELRALELEELLAELLAAGSGGTIDCLRWSPVEPLVYWIEFTAEECADTLAKTGPLSVLLKSYPKMAPDEEPTATICPASSNVKHVKEGHWNRSQQRSDFETIYKKEFSSPASEELWKEEEKNRLVNVSKSRIRFEPCRKKKRGVGVREHHFGSGCKMSHLRLACTLRREACKAGTGVDIPYADASVVAPRGEDRLAKWREKESDATVALSPARLLVEVNVATACPVMRLCSNTSPLSLPDAMCCSLELHLAHDRPNSFVPRSLRQSG